MKNLKLCFAIGLLAFALTLAVECQNKPVKKSVNHAIDTDADSLEGYKEDTTLLNHSEIKQ